MVKNVVGYEEAWPLSLLIVVDLLDAYTRADNLPGASTMLQHM